MALLKKHATSKEVGGFSTNSLNRKVILLAIKSFAIIAIVGGHAIMASALTSYLHNLKVLPYLPPSNFISYLVSIKFIQTSPCPQDGGINFGIFPDVVGGIGVFEILSHPGANFR